MRSYLVLVDNKLLVSRRRQATTWARGMTEEQFIDREVQLEKLEHATDGKLISWFVLLCSTVTQLSYNIVQLKGTCPQK